MTQYPREDGRRLPAWETISQADREYLAGQTPYRLQTIMYATHVTAVPAAEFTADITAADRRLAALLDAETGARAYFGNWTFAKAAHETDPMRAAEAEYYLCDALIEYGNQHHGGVWSSTFPVLDHTLYGRHQTPPTDNQ
ncbi:hypothetical protein [Streptomyces uncialis]|uniref:hypothetical protein n=1 Tax=Streptomyces uncialis TaxID=1048205 RepID=UPI00386D0365|nr:hypothetical protein OG924_17430 [Streptomyces uncialis]